MKDTKEHKSKNKLTERKLSMIGSPQYYEDMIKKDPMDQNAYGRLMVLYRQQKEYKKELQIINKAIKIFSPLYVSKKGSDRKLNSISMQLNKALGLTDNKGKLLYEQKPISTWKKRREIVLGKLKR